jgi:hypothetical protein
MGASSGEPQDACLSQTERLLLDAAGDELLLCFAVGEGVEGELAGGLGAQLEEDAGAAVGVGVDGVDGAEPGGAAEVGCVRDGEEAEVELGDGLGLGGLGGLCGWRGLRDEGEIDGPAGGEGDSAV